MDTFSTQKRNIYLYKKIHTSDSSFSDSNIKCNNECSVSLTFI